MIETVSCLLLLRVASGKRLKNLKKSGQLLHVFFIIIIKSLGYFDDSECKVDYTFPDSHFYIKGFRQYTAKIVTVVGVVSSFMSQED